MPAQRTALLYIVLGDHREHDSQDALYCGFDKNAAYDAQIAYLRRHEVGKYGVFKTRAEFDSELREIGKAKFVKRYYALNYQCATRLCKRVKLPAQA